MPKTYDTISLTTIPSATNSVTIGSIPSTYTDIVVKFWSPNTSGSGENYAMRFNGDTGANYSVVRDLSNNPFATGDVVNNATYVIGILGNSTYSTVATWDILGYSSNKFKLILHKGSTYSQRTDMVGATWANTTAINSITIFQTGGTYTMPAGTKISIHGILRA
jgi:hypothetical protein